MKKTATAPRTRRNGSAPRKRLETIVNASASMRIGTRPVQNLDHRKLRIGMGAVRMIQKAGPSADTAGKTKRTATAESTKEAMARFTNAYTFFTIVPMYGMRSRSSTRKL